MNAKDRIILDRALHQMGQRNQLVVRSICLPRICSVTGNPYAALYQQKSGLWEFLECARASGGSSGQQEQMKIDWRLLRGMGREVCPWCRAGTKKLGHGYSATIRCGDCGQEVCTGRSAGSSFNCCAQCGASGIIEGFAGSVAAYEVIANLLGTSQQARVGTSKPNRLMLTDGR